MKAVVLHQPGPTEDLTLEQCPVPKAQQGQVVIEVKAFELSRL